MAVSRSSSILQTRVQQLEPIYQRILSLFARDIQFAFAYGSGVFDQAGQNDTKRVNNCVKSTLKW